MPWPRPTKQQLLDRAIADIITHLPGADPLTRRSNLGVLARVTVGQAHMLHGHIEYQGQQIFPDTCDGANLERMASLRAVYPKSATAASGQAAIYGTPGATVPAEILLQRSDGARFRVAAQAALSGTSALVSLEAVEAGQAGNTAAGTALTLVSPQDGLRSPALVASDGLTGGADKESQASLAARYKQRVQRPPQGGSGDDFWRWAMEVPGITRAYVYPRRMGAGTVAIAVLADDASYGPIPSADDVARVQAYLQELDPVSGHALRRPVCCDIYVFAPEALPQEFSIHISPDTPAIRTAVEAELRDLLRRESVPEGTMLVSHYREAISLAAGEVDHTLIAPTANVTAGTGQMITMGAITWS